MSCLCQGNLFSVDTCTYVYCKHSRFHNSVMLSNNPFPYADVRYQLLHCSGQATLLSDPASLFTKAISLKLWCEAPIWWYRGFIERLTAGIQHGSLARSLQTSAPIATGHDVFLVKHLTKLIGLNTHWNSCWVLIISAQFACSMMICLFKDILIQGITIWAAVHAILMPYAYQCTLWSNET